MLSNADRALGRLDESIQTLPNSDSSTSRSMLRSDSSASLLSVATWLLCHPHAFTFFGGVPERILLDNLKAAILHA